MIESPVTWLARILFLLLLYVFLFQLYRGLVQASVSDVRRAVKLRVISKAPDGDVWVKEGDGKKRRLLPGESVVIDERCEIGRAPQADVTLSDPYASWRHCIVRRRGREWFVQDVGSTNGTRVDGATINGESPLTSGALVQVGETRFRFEVN